eukprot:350177-Chlamydomonas_euryale.AAC.1
MSSNAWLNANARTVCFPSFILTVCSSASARSCFDNGRGARPGWYQHVVHGRVGMLCLGVGRSPWPPASSQPPRLPFQVD